MAGRHAKQRGRHAAPPSRPPLAIRLVLMALVLIAIVTLAPVLFGLGLMLGIVFGWLNRSLTKV